MSYFNQAERTFNAALKMALALKTERREFGEEDDEPAQGTAQAADPGRAEGPAPEVAADPVESASQGAVVPAREVEKPSEAVPTQVVDPVAGNNRVTPAPAVLLPAASPIEHDPCVAVIEKYVKEFAHLREFDHLN